VVWWDEVVWWDKKEERRGKCEGFVIKMGVGGKVWVRRWRDGVREGFGFGGVDFAVVVGADGDVGAAGDVGLVSFCCCCVSSSKALASLSASVCQWKAGRESRAMKARGRWRDGLLLLLFSPV
jgi:hypothetical protein